MVVYLLKAVLKDSCCCRDTVTSGVHFKKEALPFWSLTQAKLSA